MTRSDDISELEKILGYTFKDKTLLDEAMSHPSLAGQKNYQRLEFLGDRVLGVVIATWIYKDFSDEDEGHLNRRFSSLVRGETLADLSLGLGLDSFIKMTRAAQIEGTAEKPTVLADICEAVIGAIYLDSGMVNASAFIHKNWTALMERGPSDKKDPKSKLQEWSQKRSLPLPRYNVVDRSGPDHQPLFTIEVSIEGFGSAKAQGNSKQQAQKVAAETMLIQLENSA